MRERGFLARAGIIYRPDTEKSTIEHTARHGAYVLHSPSSSMLGSGGMISSCLGIPSLRAACVAAVACRANERRHSVPFPRRKGVHRGRQATDLVENLLVEPPLVDLREAGTTRGSKCRRSGGRGCYRGGLGSKHAEEGRLLCAAIDPRREAEEPASNQSAPHSTWSKQSKRDQIQQKHGPLLPPRQVLPTQM